MLSESLIIRHNVTCKFKINCCHDNYKNIISVFLDNHTLHIVTIHIHKHHYNVL